MELALKPLIKPGIDRECAGDRAEESILVSVYAPFRLLIAAVTALVIATIIASSSAHAMLLGDAVVRSAPGAPLRAVIPLGPSPGEAVEESCFRLIPPADAAGSMVTARVSLERAAATPRLVVTSPNAFVDPVARFAIESRCGGTTRRNYALMVDPRANAGVRTTAIGGSNPTSTHEPGQERLESGRKADRQRTRWT
jgi:Tfp pilus assembly protein FimV